MFIAQDLFRTILLFVQPQGDRGGDAGRDRRSAAGPDRQLAQRVDDRSRGQLGLDRADRPGRLSYNFKFLWAPVIDQLLCRR